MSELPSIATMEQPRSCIRQMLRGAQPYAAPIERPWVDLYLDANEATSPLDIEIGAVQRAAAYANRYTTPAMLEERIAAQWGIEPSWVIVTAGADEAIDRMCRACIEPAKNGVQSTVVLPTPTFEMIGRFATLAGARMVCPEWNAENYWAFPTRQVLDAIDETTAMVAIVTPNNPTGAVIGEQDFRTIVERCREVGAAVLLDHAYAEFADIDLTRVAFNYGNVVTMRTYSKAWGLAGLRVGYAIGSQGGEIITAMRAVGSPFPVSRLSLAAVIATIDDDLAAQRVRDRVDMIRSVREHLRSLLDELGAEPFPSQGNFVLARFANTEWIRSALASLGIAVRLFKQDAPGTSTLLKGCLRIGCPEDPEKSERLLAALHAVMKPEAILFDMDGVLADVSRSYRAAIIQTAVSFGVNVTPEDIYRLKAAGNANNDWIVTHRLVTAAGVDASLADVTAKFQKFYLGTSDKPGLETTETLIPPAEWLSQLKTRTRLGIVTGRPRDEAMRFLRRFGLDSLFETIVCMEDGPAKPDPSPVRLALQQMNVKSAWLIGDTPDDIVAARRAGVVPIAIVAPSEKRPTGDAQERDSLLHHGPALILDTLQQLQELLP